MSISQEVNMERTDEEEVWEAKSISELTRKQIETECRRFDINPKGARKRLNNRIRNLYSSKDGYFTRECKRRRLEVSGSPFEKRRRLNRYGYLGLSALSDDNLAEMLRRRNLKLENKMRRKDMIESVLRYEAEVYGKRYNVSNVTKPGNFAAGEIPPVLDEVPSTSKGPSRPASTERPEIAETTEDPEISEIPKAPTEILTPKSLLVKLEGELAKMPKLEILGLPFHQKNIRDDGNSFWCLCAQAMTPKEDWRNVRMNAKRLWDLAVRNSSPPNRIKELRGPQYISIHKHLTEKASGNEQRSLALQFGDDGVQNPDQMFQIVLDAYGVEIFVHSPIFSETAKSISDTRWLYRVLGSEQTEACNQIHVVYYESLGQWTVLHRPENPRPRAIKVIAHYDRYKKEQPSDPNHIRYGYRSPNPKPLPRIKDARRGQDYVVHFEDQVKKNVSDAIAVANYGLSLADPFTNAFGFGPGPSNWPF